MLNVKMRSSLKYFAKFIAIENMKQDCESKVVCAMNLPVKHKESNLRKKSLTEWIHVRTITVLSYH